MMHFANWFWKHTLIIQKIVFVYLVVFAAVFTTMLVVDSRELFLACSNYSTEGALSICCRLLMCASWGYCALYFTVLSVSMVREARDQFERAQLEFLKNIS